MVALALGAKSKCKRKRLPEHLVLSWVIRECGDHSVEIVGHGGGDVRSAV